MGVFFGPCSLEQMLYLEKHGLFSVKEPGLFSSKLLSVAQKNKQRVARMRKSSTGQYTVIEIDKFSGSNLIEGHYNSAKEALKKARSLTKEAMKLASGSSVATVYYAYGPDGKYLGGDVWKNE